MKTQWLHFLPSPAYFGGGYCEQDGSPYLDWLDLLNDAIPYDIEFFCRLIAELAEEALSIERGANG